MFFGTDINMKKITAYSLIVLIAMAFAGGIFGIRYLIKQPSVIGRLLPDLNGTAINNVNKGLNFQSDRREKILILMADNLTCHHCLETLYNRIDGLKSMFTDKVIIYVLYSGKIPLEHRDFLPKERGLVFIENTKDYRNAISLSPGLLFADKNNIIRYFSGLPQGLAEWDKCIRKLKTAAR